MRLKFFIIGTIVSSGFTQTNATNVFFYPNAETEKPVKWMEDVRKVVFSGDVVSLNGING